MPRRVHAAAAEALHAVMSASVGLPTSIGEPASDGPLLLELLLLELELLLELLLLDLPLSLPDEASDFAPESLFDEPESGVGLLVDELELQARIAALEVSVRKDVMARPVRIRIRSSFVCRSCILAVIKGWNALLPRGARVLRSIFVRLPARSRRQARGR